jgi:hypothetical protein
MGANTYNNIQIVPGSGVLTFTGAFTFANMTMASAGTKTVKFTKTITYTMTGTDFLNTAGTSTSLVTIDTDDGAGTWTLNKTSGTVNSDYLSLTRSVASGGASFYAGPTSHSTDGGSNTGWVFTAAPGGGVTLRLLSLLGCGT